MSNSEKLKIITDNPLLEGVIDFPAYSQRLASIIEHSTPRFTVGILGEWGTGKTTLMLMIRNILDRNEKVLTVWFDAWRYEGEQFLAVIPFLRTVRLTLESTEKSRTGIWEGIKHGIELTYNAFLKSTTVNVGPVHMDLGKLVESIKDEIPVGTSLYQHVTDYLAHSLNELRKKDPEFRIVVFVDDLDRCRPEKALEVLESIKSFFDVEGIVYVIGMNYNSINTIVGEKYRDNTSDAGFDYMKKIVQLPFQIPEWEEDDMDRFLEQAIFNELTETDLVQNLRNCKRMLINAVEWNPREVKRFINNILIAESVFRPGYDGISKRPIDNLIVVQALKFRPEWKWFLKVMASDDRRIQFLEAYRNLEVDSNTKEKLLKIYPDIINACPTFFQKNNSLRQFLDSGAADILLTVEGIEQYRRALSASDFDYRMLYVMSYLQHFETTLQSINDELSDLAKPDDNDSLQLERKKELADELNLLYAQVTDYLKLAPREEKSRLIQKFISLRRSLQ